MTEEQFRRHVRERARVIRDERLVVGFDESGRLRHLGLANLPGESETWEATPWPAADATGTRPTSPAPAVVHVTHLKAGSQWILEILRRCATDRVVSPAMGSGHFAHARPEPGRIYPTVYLARDEFDAVPGSEDCRPFVVVRDLRDTPGVRVLQPLHQSFAHRPEDHGRPSPVGRHEPGGGAALSAGGRSRAERAHPTLVA